MKYSFVISFQILRYTEHLNNASVKIALCQLSLMCNCELSVTHIYFV